MKRKNFVFTLFCCLLVGLSVKVFATVKEDRNVGSFTKVSVSNGIDLYLTQGDTHSVSIETEKELIGKIEAVVENGTLIVRVKKGEKIRRNGKLTLIAHVTTPTIEAIKGSGGSDIYPQTPISSNGNVEITLSGGSDLANIAINAKEVNMRLSGGSDAKQLNVTANAFLANISGGSDIKESDINAPTVEVKASGGSDAELSVNTQMLNISASGASDVSVRGKTNTITVKASGASDIKARNLSYENSDVSKSGGSDIYLNK